MYDLIIIGAGPAGMAAAIYAARAELSFVVLEAGIAGGQILNTSDVDNYPGIPTVSGMELANRLREHCEGYGVQFQTGEVVSLVQNEHTFSIRLSDDSMLNTKTVLIATGANPKRLGVAGEEKLLGAGVSYCATCDGAFFKNRDVIVNGGGNTAVEDAIYLARICKSVTLVHRRDALRADKRLCTALHALSNVRIVWDSIITEIQGEWEVSGVKLQNVKTKEESVLPADGVFIAVGTKPNNLGFDTMIPSDANGYLIAGEDGRTGIPGIFAAGDVRTKALRQVVTAVSDGANAVASIVDYLM